MDACFDNCIFYGNTYDINIGSFDNTDVYIRNCLFKANGEDAYVMGEIIESEDKVVIV